MSESVVRTSGEASGRASKTTVLDFLYHDAARIGSFLSQFDPDGLLQSLKRSEGASSSRTGKTGSEIRGGVPAVLGGRLTGEQQDAEQETEMGERVYDPLWANALALLDYLDRHQLPVTELSAAAIGQFVLLSGPLWIVDMALLKNILGVPALKKHLLTGVASDRPPAGPRQRSDTLSEQQLSLELLPLMPHLVHARMRSGTGTAWTVLSPDRLTISTSDLALKHGAQIGGEWRMLGVLDALPDADSEAVADTDVPLFVGAIATLSTSLRPQMGRQAGEYGLTALMIYREIAQAP